LDSNEPNSASKSLLSMDRFIIRTSSNPSISTFADLSAASLIYDMDAGWNCAATGGQASCMGGADNGVVLTETLNPGSGITNFAALIPTPLFAGHTNEYLYLDVQFGARSDATADGDAQAGFEEWSALRATPVTVTAVPEPSSVALLATAVAGVAFSVRGRLKRS
jgi:hypothetical protein